MNAAPGNTLPKLLFNRALEAPDAEAVREKTRGLWRVTTWQGLSQNVLEWFFGFAGLGVQPGERVLLHGRNGPALRLAVLALQSMHAVPVPIPPDAGVAYLKEVLAQTGARVCLVESRAQATRWLSMGTVPLERLVCVNPRGLRTVRNPVLMRLDAMLALGKVQQQVRPAWFDESVTATIPQGAALVLFPTRPQKPFRGVVLTHQSLLDNADAFLADQPLNAQDSCFAQLPLCTMPEFYFSVLLQVRVGYAVNHAETPLTLARDLAEGSPTILVNTPYGWERLLQDTVGRAEQAPAFNQRWFHRFTRNAPLRAQQKRRKQPVSFWQSAAHALERLVVEGPVRQHLGMERVRVALCWGAPRGVGLFQLFHTLGIPYAQVYGGPELGGVVTQHPNPSPKPNTMGKAMARVGIRVSPGGHIQVKSPAALSAYLDQTRYLSPQLDQGWFQTSDTGFLDADGYLTITTRD